MNSATVDAYIARFIRVLDHIDAYPEGDLSVEQLASVAAFSKYHFHRQFSELFGIGVHKYVQRRRLKRAAYQLVFRPPTRILDIALTCGYDSHEAFSRAFKKAVGQSPSEFRVAPRWDPFLSMDHTLKTVRFEHMQAHPRNTHVDIVDFPTTRVAVLEHRGAPNLLMNSIREFVTWRRRTGLSPRTSATFNIIYDDIKQTPADAYRFDLCAAIHGPIEDDGTGIVEKTIPGRRCAVLRHTGTDDLLDASVRYLYTTWLPASGEEPGDFPLFLQRVRFFPEVPEHEAIVDIYLPLR